MKRSEKEARALFDDFRRKYGSGHLRMLKEIKKYPDGDEELYCYMCGDSERKHVYDFSQCLEEYYVEPFGGSLAVLLNKPRARVETANDLDGLVVNFYRVLRDCPDELARAIELTPWARAEYEESDMPTEDPVERARRFAVRCAMAFGSTLARRPGWRHSIGADDRKTQTTSYHNTWRNMPESIKLAAERLRDVQFENRPALDVIKQYGGPDMLIYADPPYVRGTRTLSGGMYRWEMTDTEHEMLLKMLASTESMVLLSGYDCRMYRDMLSGWDVATKQTRGDSASVRTECLWINPHAQERLKEQLHTGAFRRIYLAVCEGRPEPEAGVVDAPIGRVEGSLLAREVRADGQPARTRYRVLRTGAGRALLRLELETGRTHQIRVHMAHLGHPLTGDFLYGTEDTALIRRPALHSAGLELVQPLTGVLIRLCVPLPEDMERLLY